MDVGVGVEGIGEEVKAREEAMHPLAPVGDRHDTGDDFTTDDKGLARGLLCGADVLAVGGVVGHPSSLATSRDRTTTAFLVLRL